MKAAGILLLITGLVLVVSTFALLHPTSPRGAFVIAGIAVQVLGLIILFRAHLTTDGGR